MPKVEADDAPHSSFTDHLVRVVDGEIEGVATASGDGLRPVFARDEDDAVAQGMAYVLLGQTEGSRETLASGADRLREALERAPEAGEAQFLLGFALLKLNKPTDAIEPLRAAVAVQANPERLNALAEAYERAGQASGDPAALYQQALQIQPAAAGIRVNYGRFLEAQGRTEEALRTYQQALGAEPWNGLAHYNLGTLLARQGDAPGAVARLREAVRLIPTHGDALTNLGVLLAQQGNESEAGPLLVRAVEAEPRNANAQANLALYRLNTGDLDDALDRARLAIQFNPGQQTAQQVLSILQQNGIQ
ncbi:MAG: tetratricopeptide repeat protein [Bacteroidota bacterium]